MTIACPQCGAPAEFSAGPLSSAGRMMRCIRCGTSWLGRLQADDPYGSGPVALPPRGRPRFERIIEHADPDFTAAPQIFGRAANRRADGRAAASARPKANGRGWLAAWSGVGFAVVLAALATATVLKSSGVDAAPERGSGRYAGLEVRLLDGGLAVLGNGRAVAVSGEIVNRSDDARDVPAVRVALKAKGTELYSWTIEPTAMKVAAGGSVQFRSALAASPSGIDEVAFRLADRREFIVGMH